MFIHLVYALFSIYSFMHACIHSLGLHTPFLYTSSQLSSHLFLQNTSRDFEAAWDRPRRRRRDIKEAAEMYYVFLDLDSHILVFTAALYIFTAVFTPVSTEYFT